MTRMVAAGGPGVSDSPRPGPRRDAWLERWRGMSADLARMRARPRSADALTDELDGRTIMIAQRWLADFGSGDYIGFALEQEILDAVPGYLQKWGTHRGWSRLPGGPRHYGEIEERLTALLRAEDVLVLPASADMHRSMIPLLAEGGTIFLDHRAEDDVRGGCSVAHAQGARVELFEHHDLDRLASLLGGKRRGPKLICVDGVSIMTGPAPDLGSIAMLARAHDALLYVDDTHGFGVIGERCADEPCEYGKHGNSLIRHLGESYDDVVLVGGFIKAHSSLLSFVALPSNLKRALNPAVPVRLRSNPPEISALATVLEGLSVNERNGDLLRRKLHRLSRRLIDALPELGWGVANGCGYPVIELPLSDADQLDRAWHFLFERGIHVPLAAQTTGLRIHLSPANTDAQVSRLIEALRELRGNVAQPPPVGCTAPDGTSASPAAGTRFASAVPVAQTSRLARAPAMIAAP
jgi:8-amino-7-oxononanoate synthase